MRVIDSESDIQGLFDEIIARFVGDVSLQKYEFFVEDASDAIGSGPGDIELMFKISVKAASAEWLQRNTIEMKMTKVLAGLGLEPDDVSDWVDEGSVSFNYFVTNPNFIEVTTGVVRDDDDGDLPEASTPGWSESKRSPLVSLMKESLGKVEAEDPEDYEEDGSIPAETLKEITQSNSLTVGQLKNILEDYEEDMPIMMAWQKRYPMMSSIDDDVVEVDGIIFIGEKTHLTYLPAAAAAELGWGRGH